VTVGTAGHIDHGKSALVEALTGVHPDRLPEERRRGMTLDLGFGHASWQGIAFGFVDVPGHERFVRTMLAGAAGVDLLLLVVAADDGVRPQTIEHVAVCRLLGLRQGVIALTKSDLAAPARREAVRREIAALAAGTFLESAPIVAVSTRTGEGLGELRAALAAAAARDPARSPAGPFRLPLDRAFSLRGFGAVVTGTLLQGAITSEDEVELAPQGRRLRVRGLQVHGAPAAAARAGQRIAVNLAGMEAAELARGQELVEPGVFAPVAALEAELEWLPGAVPPRSHTRLRLHLHTAERLATLVWLEAPRWAQLRLEAPLLAAPGDRFILRRLSPAATLGGGCVLLVAPSPRRRAEAAIAAAHLRALAAAQAAADTRGAVALHVAAAGASGLAAEALARRLGRRLPDVLADLAALQAEGALVLAGNPVAALAAARFAALQVELLAALAAVHARAPLEPGAPLEALGLAAPPPWPAAAAARLRSQRQLELVAGTRRLRLPGRAPALSPAQRGLQDRLEVHFRQAGLAAPPLPAALAAFPQPEARALLAALARAGRLVECAPGWFLHADALDGLLARLAERKRAQPEFGVGDFKLWTGLSRKAAIPLLEYLDRRRVTHRLDAHRRRLL
jgi:selenocysteine-specific elongation factor